MRLVRACAVAVAVTSCGGQSPFFGGSAVARAAGQELSVERLAEIMGRARHLPLTADIAERLAHRWVEYTLFAQRVARGDSLLDPATVRRAMWAELDQQLVDAYYSRVLAERLRFDSAVVDSVYAAGEYRLVQHILVAVPSPARRDAARRRAERIRAAVAAGGSWVAASRQSDDTATRATAGSVGVIARGHVLPEFEEVAFRLAPGELSAVFETPAGFHIARRPPLAEVRSEFARGVYAALQQRVTDQFLDELAREWNIEVRPEAPRAMREAAGAPLRALRSRAVLGSHREGRFTVADFVRWLNVLSLDRQERVASAGDEALIEMARSMIRNEALVRAARAAGVAADSALEQEARLQLAGEIRLVRRALGLDSALAAAEAPAQRSRAAARAVDRYVEAYTRSLADVVVVPVFLAAALREDARWEVSERGILRAVERAREVRRAGVAP